MNLPLDPVMLLSVVNMNLRDRYSSLTDFCKSNNVDEEDIKKVDDTEKKPFSDILSKVLSDKDENSGGKQ